MIYGHDAGFDLMAYRGGSRAGFGGRLAKQVPFELFPEVENLGNAASVTRKDGVGNLALKITSIGTPLLTIWERKVMLQKKAKGMDIERFSDRTLERAKSKPPLAHFIRMDPAYVPAELAKGGREEKHAAKRVRWNPESDMQKLDLLEKLDQKSK
ncbi:hypothetical protein HAX54_020411, partial [Datura stramonium]|nr:hypothetical protein [Datura stramonium]